MLSQHTYLFWAKKVAPGVAEGLPKAAYMAALLGLGAERLLQPLKVQLIGIVAGSSAPGACSDSSDSDSDAGSGSEVEAEGSAGHARADTSDTGEGDACSDDDDDDNDGDDNSNNAVGARCAEVASFVAITVCSDDPWLCTPPTAGAAPPLGPSPGPISLVAPVEPLAREFVAAAVARAPCLEPVGRPPDLPDAPGGRAEAEQDHNRAGIACARLKHRNTLLFNGGADGERRALHWCKQIVGLLDLHTMHHTPVIWEQCHSCGHFKFICADPGQARAQGAGRERREADKCWWWLKLDGNPQTLTEFESAVRDARVHMLETGGRVGPPWCLHQIPGIKDDHGADPIHHAAC